MSPEYNPSGDFVARVMDAVKAYERSKTPFQERLGDHPFVRYILVLSGTLFGVFQAVSAF